MKTEREKKLPSLLILVFVGSAWGSWAPDTMQYIPHKIFPTQTNLKTIFFFPAETNGIGFKTRWEIQPGCVSERLLLYQHHKIKHSGITLPMSSLVSPKTFDSDTVTDNFSCSTLQCFVSYFLLPWDTKVAELLWADDQKRENTKGNQRQSGKKAKADFPTLC